MVLISIYPANLHIYDMNEFEHKLKINVHDFGARIQRNYFWNIFV